MRNVRFIGLDVHAETIAVAVAEAGGEVRSLGTIPNRAESVRRLVKKLGKPEQLRVCYEAGPTGYVLYWQLTRAGREMRGGGPDAGAGQGRGPGEDRSARCREAGALLSGRGPDGGVGAGCGARGAAGLGAGAARRRSAISCVPATGSSKFLLRHGRRAPRGCEGMDGASIWRWVKQQRFEQAAQQATLVDYLHEVEHAAERIVRLGALDRCGDRDAAARRCVR